MDLEILVNKLAFISDRCYCAIKLKNGQVLLPIFNLTYFQKRLPEKHILKFVYLVNAKGNTKKETRKFNLPSL